MPDLPGLLEYLDCTQRVCQWNPGVNPVQLPQIDHILS
jgi:hypothetical protein